MAAEVKTCTKCGETKLIGMFWVKGNGHRPACAQCEAGLAREYYHQRKAERGRAFSARWEIAYYSHTDKRDILRGWCAIARQIRKEEAILRKAGYDPEKVDCLTADRIIQEAL